MENISDTFLKMESIEVEALQVLGITRQLTLASTISPVELRMQANKLTTKHYII